MFSFNNASTMPGGGILSIALAYMYRGSEK